MNVSLSLAGLADLTRPPPAAPSAPSAPPAPPAPAPAAPAPASTAAPAQPPAPTQPATPPAAEEDASREVRKLREQIRATTIASFVKDKSTELGAIAHEDVLTLVREHFTTDDRGNVVVRADPTVKPDEYLATFLAARPYMLRPRVPTGAGAPSTVTPPAPAPPAPPITTSEGATLHVHNALARRFGALTGPAPAAPAASTAATAAATR